MSKKKPRALGLSDDWRLWVVENLVRGVSAARLVTTLTEDGVPLDVARREVRGITRSPTLDACRRLRRRIAQRELVIRLGRALAQTGSRAGRLATFRDLGELGAARFFDEFWAANRPLKLTHAASDWPALTRWQPRLLAERFGDCTIEVETARAEAKNHEGSYVSMRLAEFVSKLEAIERSNDLYCIARNKNAERLDGLFDDIVLDETVFDATRLGGGGTSLWIGPRGTNTPLHHDTTNILFHQIVGEKRFRLAPPSETSLLSGLEGFYAAARLDDSATLDVTLSPGQALFIPVGWYHQVEALSHSVSFSLLCFRRDNDFSWYAPGKCQP